MDEAEWQVSTDPQAMLFAVAATLYGLPVVFSDPTFSGPTLPRPSDRKLRLWAAAYHRGLAPRHGNWHEFRAAIDWSERIADGAITYAQVPRNVRGWQSCPSPETTPYDWMLRDIQGDPETQVQGANLLREVLGNPFQARTGRDGLEVSRLTPTVRQLAQAAYDERDEDCSACNGTGQSRSGLNNCGGCNGTGRGIGTLESDRLAILADALEEAGCDNVDLLHHCRDKGKWPFTGLRHVRGCWALDLILGKE